MHFSPLHFAGFSSSFTNPGVGRVGVVLGGEARLPTTTTTTKKAVTSAGLMDGLARKDNGAMHQVFPSP